MERSTRSGTIVHLSAHNEATAARAIRADRSISAKAQESLSPSSGPCVENAAEEPRLLVGWTAGPIGLADMAECIFVRFDSIPRAVVKSPRLRSPFIKARFPTGGLSGSLSPRPKALSPPTASRRRRRRCYGSRLIRSDAPE